MGCKFWIFTPLRCAEMVMLFHARKSRNRLERRSPPDDFGFVGTSDRLTFSIMVKQIHTFDGRQQGFEFW